MTDPQIQYAKTDDGVSIAYYTLGSGPALVRMPTDFFSHVQLEWQIPEMRRAFERLAEGRMMIRYDGRGLGLSDRDVTEISLKTYLLDLRAVIDRLEVDRVVLMAPFFTGGVAVSIAARYPELVSHLILWCARTRWSDQSPGVQALERVADTDWKLYTNALAGLMGLPPEETSALATFLRQSVTSDVLKPYLAFSQEFDATPLLPDVSVPTLVLHRSEFEMTDVSVARKIASGIPNARLVLLDGSSASMWAPDIDSMIDAIEGFLGEETRRQ